MSDPGESAGSRQEDALRLPPKPGDGSPWHDPPASWEAGGELPDDSETSRSQADLDITSSATWQRLIESARNGCREAQTVLFASVRHQLDLTFEEVATALGCSRDAASKR